MDYILVESFGKPQIRKNLWYVMEYDDLAALAEAEDVTFGDQAFVLETTDTYIMGSDGSWYPAAPDDGGEQPK